MLKRHTEEHSNLSAYLKYKTMSSQHTHLPSDWSAYAYDRWWTPHMANQPASWAPRRYVHKSHGRRWNSSQRNTGCKHHGFPSWFCGSKDTSRTQKYKTGNPSSVLLRFCGTRSKSFFCDLFHIADKRQILLTSTGLSRTYFLAAYKLKFILWNRLNESLHFPFHSPKIKQCFVVLAQSKKGSYYFSRNKSLNFTTNHVTKSFSPTISTSSAAVRIAATQRM